MKKQKKSKTKKAKLTKKQKINYYKVISKDNKFNCGAFPPDRSGLRLAKAYAEKLTLETGEKHVVEKR